MCILEVSIDGNARAEIHNTEKYEISEKFMRHSENIFEGCGDYHPSTFGNKRYAEYLIENMRG